MLRHRSVSALSSFLRQSQIRVVAYSTDESESEKGRKKLSALLSSIQSKAGKAPAKEPKLAKPSQGGSVNQVKKVGKMKNALEGIKLEGMQTEKLIIAAKEVSNLAKDDKSRLKTESDLLKKLKTITVESTAAKSENEVSGERQSASDFFSDLKVEKKPVSRVMTDRKFRQEQNANLTEEQKAFLERRARLRRQRTGDSDEASYVPQDIFGGQPLGIFTEPLPASTEPQEGLTTWRKCVQRELELLGTPSPRNALEEHILWTEQGKLWNFPVDNEQDLEYAEEKFYHHVFLTQHLQPWCPASGPIRHFMELICVGLSKNPYASVEYKKKTILWFKSYFERAEINEILVHQGLWEEKNQNKEV